MAPTEINARDAEHRWRSRPVLSAGVRTVAVVAPAAVALAFSLLAARVVPAPPGVGAKVIWWISISLLSIVVLVAVQRVARRLLPLAALLKLSLLFPDRAPTRYRMARKVGRPKDLENQLHRAREAGRDGHDTLGPQGVLELVASLSVHDRATRGHSERVRIFTDLIAAELKLPQPDQDRLRWAALLHDVGKLKVPASILRKPGAPTPAEWTALRLHPVHGSLLIAPIASWLGEWALAVPHHHERFDGAGYPSGLHGEQISLGGRIVAVADCYETMTAARPYKRPISPIAARNELVRCSGAQFDPAVVRAFLNVSLGRLWRTIGLGAWVSQVPLLPQVSSGLSAVGAQAVPMASRGAVGLALMATVAAATPSGPTATASTTVTSQGGQGAQAAVGATPARPTVPSAPSRATPSRHLAAAPSAPTPLAAPQPKPKPKPKKAVPPPKPAPDVSPPPPTTTTRAPKSADPTPAPKTKNKGKNSNNGGANAQGG